MVMFAEGEDQAPRIRFDLGFVHSVQQHCAKAVVIAEDFESGLFSSEQS